MRFLLLIASLLLTPLIFGQQIAQYSQWSFNQFSINPALAGIKNCLDVRSAYRLQWAGFEGAPESGLFTINAPLNKKRKHLNSSFHGLGGKIERDVFGHFQNFAVSMAYALHFPLDQEKRLSFGISAGVQQFSFNQEGVSTIDPDPAVVQSANVFMVPLIGAGAWYNSERFYVGASVDQLARNRWEDVGFSSRFQMHFKLAAGTRLNLENNYSLLPSVLIRIPPAGPPSVDLNAMFDFGNNFMLGAGFRNVDAVIAFLRLRIKKITIGYSFDYITSNIQGGNFHTHEISVMYNNCKSRNTKAAACPLFE